LQYYENVNDFSSQYDVDSALSTICAMLQVPRLHLRVLATSKGIVAGSLTFRLKGRGEGDVVRRLDCRNSPGGEMVPQNLTKAAVDIESDARSSH
jgi:DNA topoisomerase VI subunit A